MDIESNNSDGGETKDYDEGTENLDMLLRIMEGREKLKHHMLPLGNAFIDDV